MVDQNLPLNAAEHQQMLQRFPRATFWFGMHDRHPDIHPVLEQLHANPYAGWLDPQNRNAGQAGQANVLPIQGHHVPPPVAPPFAGPQPPVIPPQPMYAPNPGFAGLYPHGHFAPGQYHPLMPPPLPPHYRERPNPVPNAAVPVNPRQPAREVSHIDLSIPRNTEVPDGIITRVPLRLPADLSFEDFYSRVCATMDLVPERAVLGYKFNGDRVGDLPNRLANTDDYESAILRAKEKIKRARTRDVILEIYNLRQPAAGSRSKKDGAPGNMKKRIHRPEEGDENEDSTSISCVTQLRQLKQKLFCQRHDCHCYINPINGDHVTMTTWMLTLWAKKILMNEATYQRPPEHSLFNHAPKRRRPSPKATTTPPPINIYLSPLGDVTRKHINQGSSPTHSDGTTGTEDTVLVFYPLISKVLRELHEVMPLNNYPQYTSAFEKNGIVYANAALNLDVSYFVDVIHMPRPIVQAFVDHVHRVVKKARKGKDRVPSIEEEETEYLTLSD